MSRRLLARCAIVHCIAHTASRLYAINCYRRTLVATSPALRLAGLIVIDVTILGGLTFVTRTARTPSQLARSHAVRSHLAATLSIAPNHQSTLENVRCLAGVVFSFILFSLITGCRLVSVKYLLKFLRLSSCVLPLLSSVTCLLLLKARCRNAC